VYRGVEVCQHYIIHERTHSTVFIKGQNTCYIVEIHSLVLTKFDGYLSILDHFTTVLTKVSFLDQLMQCHQHTSKTLGFPVFISSPFISFKITIFCSSKYEQDGKALNVHLQRPSRTLTKLQYDIKCSLTKIRKHKDMTSLKHENIKHRKQKYKFIKPVKMINT